MAALSTDTFALDASGTSLTWNSASGSGDSFSNNGRTVIIAQNGATASCAVTVAATQTVTDASLSVPDLTISVAASTTVAIGPLPKATFNDASSSVDLTYSNESTLTIAIVAW